MIATLNIILFLFTNQAPILTTMTYKIAVDNIVAGIRSQTANESPLIHLTNSFISHTSHDINFPIRSPTTGTHENVSNAISTYNIKLDNGTTITLASRK